MHKATSGAAKSFDLLDNPFFILGLDPTAPVERIAEAFDDAIADGNSSEAVLFAAREALINPRQRLAAELSYPLDSTSGQVELLIASLRQQTASDHILRNAERLAPLSKSNVLAHLACITPATSDVIFAIIDAHAQLDESALVQKLESQRQQARFVIPSLDAVRSELQNVQTIHVKALLAGFGKAAHAAKPIRECVKRVLASADADRVEVLERLLKGYEGLIASDQGAIEEQINTTIDGLKTSNSRDYAPLKSALQSWAELTSPLIEIEAYKGRDEPRTRQLFYAIRGLCIDKANERQDFDGASAILEIAKNAFGRLPRASEQLREDTKLLNENALGHKALPLSAFVENVSKWTIAADLGVGGFGPNGRGDAAKLWMLFSNAANALQNTDAADLPWVLVRGLAIDLNNDENSPSAAVAIIESLLAFSIKASPSAQMLEKLKEDLRVVRKNSSEKQIIKLVESGSISRALRELNELLQTNLTLEERVPLDQLRGQLQRKQNVTYVKWAFFSIVGLFIVAANIPDKSKVPSTTYPPYPSPTTQPTPRSPQNQPTAPVEEVVETKPAIGRGELLARSSIRYCRYQKERLKTVEKDIRNDFETAEFNKLVDDYNARCGSFKYYENDLRAVDEEVRAKSGRLAQEGLNIVSRWRYSSIQTPSSPAPATPPVFPSPRELVPPPTSPGGLPPDPRQLPTSQSDSEPDLLNIETAISVQKRLYDLGYFRGPLNGAWGPQSRSALRAFKAANGLTSDDIADAPTLSQLNSPSAARNSTKARLPGSDSNQESYYAPRNGTTLNPLNRLDATRIHTKLRELGYFRGTNLTLWGAASRDALREFKSRNGLDANDIWDAGTEQRLLSALPPQSRAELEEAFSAAVLGTWTTDPKACPGSQGSSDALPISISSKGAVTEGARCDFESFSGAGLTWKTSATCTANAETWRTSISLIRSADSLTWSSAKGTVKYSRCPE